MTIIRNRLIKHIYPPALAMTSNNTPPPFVASSSSLLGSFFAWSAFDGSALTNSVAILNSLPSQLSIDFGATYSVSQVRVLAREGYGTTQQPKDFTLQSSLDGTNWTIFATYTGQTFVDSIFNTYTFAPVNARHFRLNTTAVGDGSIYTSIQELIWE